MADELNVGNKKRTVIVIADTGTGSDYIRLDSASIRVIKRGDIIKHGSNYYEITSFVGTKVYIKPNLKSNLYERDKLELFEKGKDDKITKETKKILLSYNTKTIEDPNRWEDYKSQTPGENGYYFEEWEVKEYSDGRTERTKLRTYGRVEPKDSIITVGTKPVNRTEDNVSYKDIAITKNTVYSKDKPYSTPNSTTSGTQGKIKVTETVSYYKDNQTGSTKKEETVTEMVPEITTIYIGEKLDGGYDKGGGWLTFKGLEFKNKGAYRNKTKLNESMTHYYNVESGDGVSVATLGNPFNAYDYIHILTGLTKNGQTFFNYIKKDDTYFRRYTASVPENEAEDFVKSFYELRTLVSTTEEKEKVAIKPKTKTVTDSSKYEDYSHTKPGTDGYYYKIYEIRKYSDDTTEKVFIKNSEVIEEAVPTIITKGTKPIHTTDYRYEEKLSDKIAEETQKDPNLYTDETEVIDGVPDTLKLTYLRHYEKGVFKREEFIKSEVIKPGKPKITKIGTKPIDSTDYRYEEKPAETIEEKVVEDESIFFGKKEVIKGTPDTLKLTYLRHYKKGVFTHEELVDTRVIKKGTPTIIKKGTKKFPYLWRRLKVTRTTGEVEYTGHELVNSHTKDIQKLDSYFKGYQELTDKEFKRTLEKIESQKSIIDGKFLETRTSINELKETSDSAIRRITSTVESQNFENNKKFSETRTSINELKETTDSAIRNITSTVENKLSGYTSYLNTRFEQMNNKFGLYVTESTYNRDKSTYQSRFSSIEQKANSIELSIAGKTDSSDVRNIFSSMTLTDRQIKSITDKFTIESRSGTYRNEMKLGNFTSYKDGYKQFEVNERGLEMYARGERVTELATTVWGGNGSNNFRLGHRESSMTISYHNAKTDYFNPYITFDKYNTSGSLARSDYPIKISQNVEMAGNFWMKPGMNLWIGDSFKIYSSKYGVDDICYMVTGSGRYGIAFTWDKLFFVYNNVLREVFSGY